MTWTPIPVFASLSLAKLDSHVNAALNADMSKNQHRWKESLGKKVVGALMNSGEQLAWAWELDMEYPNSYPLNTHHAFHEIKTRVGECQSQNRAQMPNATLRRGIRRALPPRSFSELVGEGTIRAVYEEQNVGNYIDALKLARSGDKSATRTFRKILNAVEAAYIIEHCGDDSAPKPRVNFLHRNLLEIADLLHLNDLTHDGLVEFLDDLCPCGKRHKRDALRKLRQRRGRSTLQKS
jgi:hypothetical protein